MQSKIHIDHKSELELLLTIRAKPLKISDLTSIASKFELSPAQTANLADLSLRTFQTKSKASYLTVNASEKIVRLRTLYKLGLTVFDENRESFAFWLKSPIPALKQMTPNDLLTTHLGIDVVKEELQRIEFSVY